jgi:hypothetical protein
LFGVCWQARADAALIKGLMRRTAEDVITIGQALWRIAPCFVV